MLLGQAPVEAESESIQWTQRFDRPLADLFALQEDLVTEVAAQLGLQVERVEIEQALKKPGNFSPWEALMRADANMRHATRSGYEASAAEARRALELDPNEGFAHAYLASALGQVWRHGGGEDAELEHEIAEHVRRARALVPENPGVMAGTVHALGFLGKLQEALPLAERAVAMHPNLEVAHRALGQLLVRLGRSDEALAELDAAARLGPTSFWLYHSWIWRAVAHLQAGRPDQALGAAERAVRLLPAPEALIQIMLCSAKLNRWDGARDALRRLRDADPEMSCGQIEHPVRDFYCGSDDVEGYVATVRQVWDEVAAAR